MSNTQTTRRSFIEMAAAMVPVAALSACTGGDTGGLVAKLSQMVGAEPLAAGKSETQIWQDAVGKSFRLGGESGPVFASLTAVTAQSAGGERPFDLRQQPLLLSFTLDAGYDAQGDQVFFLDRMMGAESRLFMQRGTDANGRPELVALLN